jgi:predicted DsbA family dithiol-disulfide isomerase
MRRISRWRNRSARGKRQGMTAHIEIDFVSDVACPWCAIGLAGLEESLRRSADAISATIRFQPFELHPSMPPGGENIDEFIGGRYSADTARLEAMRADVRARAANVGVEFNQNASSRIYNTFDAHRLLQWAMESGKQLALKHALFKANFADNADISSHAILICAAVTAGLDAAEAEAVLTSGRYAAGVREAEQLWMSRGIQAVPAIIVNGQWLISGGQTPETFEKTLRQIIATTA